MTAISPASTCQKQPTSTDLFIKGKETVIIGYTDCVLALRVRHCALPTIESFFLTFAVDISHVGYKRSSDGSINERWSDIEEVQSDFGSLSRRRTQNEHKMNSARNVYKNYLKMYFMVLIMANVWLKV